MMTAGKGLHGAANALGEWWYLEDCPAISNFFLLLRFAALHCHTYMRSALFSCLPGR